MAVKAKNRGAKRAPSRRATMVTSENFEALLLESARQARQIAERERAPTRVYQVSARHTTVPKPKPFLRGDVVRVRAKLGVSQSVLAALVGRSGAAVRSWELEGSGKEPDGAAARLLDIFERFPKIAKAYLRRKA